MPRDYHRQNRYGAQSRDQQDRMLQAWAAERERERQGSVRRAPATLPYVPVRRGPRSRDVGEWMQQLAEDERDDARFHASQGPPRTNSQLAAFARYSAGASDSADRNSWLVAEACLDLTGTPGEAASMIMASRHIAERTKRRALELIAAILAETGPCGVCGKTDDHALNCPMRPKKKLK